MQQENYNGKMGGQWNALALKSLSAHEVLLVEIAEIFDVQNLSLYMAHENKQTGNTK